MELRRTVSTLALGGALLVTIAGAANAKDFDFHGGRIHRGGPIVEFNAPWVGPYAYAYDHGCGFYRMKWNETGRHYWLRRFEECREG